MGEPLLSRRALLASAALAGLGLSFGFASRGTPRDLLAGPDPDDLVPDPGGICDLPPDFQYRIISPVGELLSDGRPVPSHPDGMAAFPGRHGTTVLVRNHEQRVADVPAPVIGRNPYDAERTGGTTAIVVAPDRRNYRAYVVSSGTADNCAGGATPWGTWLTCEEERLERHGSVFEVMWDDPENDLSRTPIAGMGYFEHEAVAVDPRTGVVYLTEDDARGVIAADPARDTRRSFLYRFLPDRPLGGPGSLHEGGRLQALALDDSTDPDLFEPGQRFTALRWVDVRPELAAEDALARGGARFNRLEGCCFSAGTLWFADTAGGEARLGQVFRFSPSAGGEPDRLELFFEATSANQMENPDNLAIAPWGDLWFAEDGEGTNRIVGLTPGGDIYPVARTALSEFAGPCFAPDGSAFFVNILGRPGMTLAITGPFPRLDRARTASLARAKPPPRLGPAIGDDLAEASRQLGIEPLEAAALQTLGLPLAAR